MAAADFFATNGHDHLVCAVLAHLDWRSILAASAACRNLNRIATTTSSLQVELRAQYYGLPDWYAQWLKSAPGDAVAKIKRLIDVQTNWCNLTPKAIYKLSTTCLDHTGQSSAVHEGEPGTLNVSGGLMVRGVIKPSEDNAAAEGEAQPPFVGWVVTDLTHSRDVSANDLPSWAYAPGFRFDTIDVCREDNAIGVITTRTGRYSRRLGGTLVYCRIHVFLAQPDAREQGVNTAVPHPEAQPVEVCGLWDVHHTEMARWGFRLSPGGVAEVGVSGRDLWVAVDWRTGQTLTHTKGSYGDGLEVRILRPMLRGQAQLLARFVFSPIIEGEDEPGPHAGSDEANPSTGDVGVNVMQSIVFRFEHALPPSSPFDPRTIEGFIEIPELLEQFDLTGLGYFDPPSFKLCLNPHGRLLVLSASGWVRTPGPEREETQTMLVAAARLEPLRRMVEERARPPSSSSNSHRDSRRDESDQSTDAVEDGTGYEGSETSSECTEGFARWERGASLPDPDPPALTAYLRQAEVAPLFACERGGPYRLEWSAAMGMRALYLAIGQRQQSDPFTLLVGDYAIPAGGDAVHRRPLGAPLMDDNEAGDVVLPPTRLPGKVSTSSDGSVRLSAPWDWSTHGSLSRSGVAADILDNTREAIFGIRADEEHIYLETWTEVIVLSF